jgi:hypothetical protein
MKLFKFVALLGLLILLFFLVGPIYFFSYFNLPVVSEVLLTSNIYRYDVNSPAWFFRESPLHVATRREQSGLVAELIKFGADPNQPSGEYGHRPLHIASMQCSTHIVNVLIEAGAKVSLPSCKVDASVENQSATPAVSQLESHLHSTPLHLVAAKSPEGCNFTALVSAMFSDMKDIVEPSIPNVHEVDHLGNTFMHQAAMHCNLPFLTWLLQDATSQYPSLSDFFGAETSTSSPSSSTLVDFKQAALAQLWQKNKFGWLPIHYASICEISSQKALPVSKKGKRFTLSQNYKNQMSGTLETILQGGEVSPPPTYANLSGKVPVLISSH